LGIAEKSGFESVYHDAFEEDGALIITIILCVTIRNIPTETPKFFDQPEHCYINRSLVFKWHRQFRRKGQFLSFNI
jgi:hypothetical protein